MKAVRFHEHGDAGVLRYEDAPDPELRGGDVVVRVRACGLNHLDLWNRRGVVRLSLPHISGADVAGEIVATSDASLAPGRRVMLQPGLSCGRCQACLEGRDNECPRYDVLGSQSDGGYAELVRVPVQNVIPLPDAIGFVEAAAFPLTFLTAWHMLVTRARIRPGDDVLVLGGGQRRRPGGDPDCAGCTARACSPRRAATKSWRARARSAPTKSSTTTRRTWPRRSAGSPATAAWTSSFEHVGTATWDRSVKCLARGGRLVTCGATTGYDAKIDLRFLFSRQLTLMGSYMGTKGELARAAQFFFTGQLHPVVDKTFPLADAAAAQTHLEKSLQFGKVVLET